MKIARPLDTAFYKWVGQGWQVAHFDEELGWYPDWILLPGEGGEIIVYSYYSSSGWSRTTPTPVVPREPRPGLGEAFFLNVPAPRTWARTFSVWP